MGAAHNGFDRLYAPFNDQTADDLNIHNLAVEGDRRPFFVNTLISSVATFYHAASFTVVSTEVRHKACGGVTAAIGIALRSAAASLVS